MDKANLGVGVTMNNEEYLAVAQELSAAIAAKDINRIKALYDDTCEVWHNFSRDKQSKASNIAMLQAIFSVCDSIHYDNVHVLSTAEGFVQYHDIVGNFNDGSHMPPIASCIVAAVRDGRIISVREWLDSAQFRELGLRMRNHN